jgi:hypothetical protein
MVHIVRRVEPREVTALLREAARLIEAGDRATDEERELYRLRKIDLLERIAAFPPAGAPGGRDAVEVASLASREAQALRARMPSTWGEV